MQSEADDVLAWVEGAHALTSGCTNIRDQFVDQGWSVPGAESAAITIWSYVLASNRE